MISKPFILCVFMEVRSPCLVSSSTILYLVLLRQGRTVFGAHQLDRCLAMNSKDLLPLFSTSNARVTGPYHPTWYLLGCGDSNSGLHAHTLKVDFKLTNNRGGKTPSCYK